MMINNSMGVFRRRSAVNNDTSESATPKPTPRTRRRIDDGYVPSAIKRMAQAPDSIAANITTISPTDGCPQPYNNERMLINMSNWQSITPRKISTPIRVGIIRDTPDSSLAGDSSVLASKELLNSANLASSASINASAAVKAAQGTVLLPNTTDVTDDCEEITSNLFEESMQLSASEEVESYEASAPVVTTPPVSAASAVAPSPNEEMNQHPKQLKEESAFDCEAQSND